MGRYIDSRLAVKIHSLAVAKAMVAYSTREQTSVSREQIRASSELGCLFPLREGLSELALRYGTGAQFTNPMTPSTHQSLSRENEAMFLADSVCRYRDYDMQARLSKQHDPRCAGAGAL